MGFEAGSRRIIVRRLQVDLAHHTHLNWVKNKNAGPFLPLSPFVCFFPFTVSKVFPCWRPRFGSYPCRNYYSMLWRNEEEKYEEREGKKFKRPLYNEPAMVTTCCAYILWFVKVDEEIKMAPGEHVGSPATVAHMIINYFACLLFANWIGSSRFPSSVFISVHPECRINGLCPLGSAKIYALRWRLGQTPLGFMGYGAVSRCRSALFPVKRIIQFCCCFGRWMWNARRRIKESLFI